MHVFCVFFTIKTAKSKSCHQHIFLSCLSFLLPLVLSWLIHCDSIPCCDEENKKDFEKGWQVSGTNHRHSILQRPRNQLRARRQHHLRVYLWFLYAIYSCNACRNCKFMHFYSRKWLYNRDAGCHQLRLVSHSGAAHTVYLLALSPVLAAAVSPFLR